MPKQTSQLLRPATRLSQNYLSLIFALIILICLSVAAGFVFVSQALDFSQQAALVGFLIIFPIFAAGVAIWLILQNVRRIKARESDHLLNWQIMSPEKQRQKLNAEITEIAHILTISDAQFSELRSAYIVAEDLALRKIEQDEKNSLLRHVVLEGAEFDAVLVNENIIRCIEVTFLVTPDVADEKVRMILRKVETTKNLLNKIRPGTKLILMLALVTQFDEKATTKLRSSLSEKLMETPVDVDIRLFDFEELQKIYAQ